jgi:hypothetical protein
MATRDKNKEGSGTLEEGARKPQVSDRLSGYREQLELVRRSSETVASLRERVSGLEARLNELTLEIAALLDSDELERESALVTTSGVIEAKLSRAREKLFQAEGALSAQLAGVKGEFGRLHLIFKLCAR